MIPSRPASGFTLLELLIALALGGLALAAAGAAAGSLSRRHLESDRMARLQERATHIFGVLEPEVQMAGYGGLQPLATVPWPTLPSTVEACGTAHLLAAVAVRVDRQSYALRCPPAGGGAATQSDGLTILRASGRTTAPIPGRVQVLTSRTSAGPQRLILNGVLPDDLALREGLHELRNLNVTSFYVARDSDGSRGLPALRVKELIEIAGRPAIRDTEVAAGVESLRIEEGWRANDDAERALQFTDNEERPAGHQLAAVRIRLQLREADQRTVTERTVALRNPPPAAR